MFILAILLFLLLYCGMSFFFGYMGWVWLKHSFNFRQKKTYITVVLIFSLTIIVGFAASSAILQTIGYFWLILSGFGLILLPIATLLFFLLKRKGIRMIGFGVISLYILIFSFGTFYAWSPVLKTYDISIDKNVERNDLKIVMASDFHLGNIVGKKHLEKFVHLIEETRPDIVLLPGDLIDDHIDPFLKGNMGETLKKIDAPLGVYATLGNHDYYGSDNEKIVEEIEKLGIEVLTDEVTMIENDFFIIGRNDDTDKNRDDIESLVSSLDSAKPMIMLDHQPNQLDAALGNGIDLILSGHTHRGQIFPGNLITGMLYENDYGLLKKGNLHSIVSSGFGTWGPPLRLGSRSEVVTINVSFQ
ncbi:metallophosphoesterase [Bacillus sp. REN16]|uniref:metallophosphoesterase n=1 Tax=Bacillus sp. REN16 TaxID=2887296 RepID=UPI001E33CAFE|nr:metallophosphoesterase [Bacillus sp. REN16]MCC3357711.1 metallophosphoesterase [Bacillus sp. REN16]